MLNEPLPLFQLWWAEPPCVEADLAALEPAMASVEEECAQLAVGVSLAAAVAWEEESSVVASPLGAGGCAALQVATSWLGEAPLLCGDASPPRQSNPLGSNTEPSPPSSQGKQHLPLPPSSSTAPSIPIGIQEKTNCVWGKSPQSEIENETHPCGPAWPSLSPAGVKHLPRGFLALQSSPGLLHQLRRSLWKTALPCHFLKPVFPSRPHGSPAPCFSCVRSPHEQKEGDDVP